MEDVKWYVIHGWRIIKHDGTEKYLNTTYVVATLEDVMQALQCVGSWQYFKVDSVEPVYYWD